MLKFARLFFSCGLPLAAAAVLSSCSMAPTVMAPGSFSTVVIDAGHGGKDSGERSRGGLLEKDMTLDTALRLEPLLQSAGFHTIMSRRNDTFVELDDRVALADSHPDSILVSIHYNASPSSFPHGIETFFWQPDSYGLAVRVQRHLVEETGLDNRGVTRRVLRLTHNPRVPCILCECGFLTNSSEAATIDDPAYRQEVAEGLAAGILEQHEKGDFEIGALPPITITPGPVHHRPAHHHPIHHQQTHHRSSHHQPARHHRRIPQDT